MAINNQITLIGNLGNEARLIESNNKDFMVASMATTDSYKDENQNWHQKEPVWHNIIAFSLSVIQILGNLKTGSRIEVLGSLSYRKFQAVNEDGQLILNKEGHPVFKQEASIIARKITLAPLPKKG